VVDDLVDRAVGLFVQAEMTHHLRDAVGILERVGDQVVGRLAARRAEVLGVLALFRHPAIVDDAVGDRPHPFAHLIGVVRAPGLGPPAVAEAGVARLIPLGAFPGARGKATEKLGIRAFVQGIIGVRQGRLAPAREIAMQELIEPLGHAGAEGKDRVGHALPGLANVEVIDADSAAQQRRVTPPDVGRH